MTATLLAELDAVGGRVSLHGDQLVIAAPLGAAPPELIDRLRAAKPALVAYLRDRCAHCAEPDGARGPLLPIGTADDGHCWVHDGCYRAWLAARRAGRGGGEVIRGRAPPPAPGCSASSELRG